LYRKIFYKSKGIFE